MSSPITHWDRLVGFTLALSLAVGLVLCSHGDAAAQFFDSNPFVLRPPAAVPAPSRSAPNWRPDTFFGFSTPPPQEQAPPVKRAPPPEPEGVVYSSAADAVQGKKHPPTQFILVLGDRLARQIADGLADSYVTERSAPAVIGITEDPSGFLPTPVDWLARFPAALQAARPNVTVIALGADDLEPIKDGDTQALPLSERWGELYGKRVDEILAAARGTTGRVVVASLVPVQSPTLSADYERLNEILRAHAGRNGAVFVNLWDGFVDEDGKYMGSGPAVDGQRRRLRQADGVRFTRAGARKLAFFIQKDLTRILAEPPPAETVGPGENTQGPISLTDGPRGANALLGGAGALPSARAAPTVPVSAGATEAIRVIREGSPLPERLGRTDDFSWPPKSAAPAAAPRGEEAAASGAQP